MPGTGAPCLGLQQRQEAQIYFSISWCQGYMSLILPAPGEFWSYGAMTLDVVIYSSLYVSSQPCSLYAKPASLLSLSGSETSCITQAACIIHVLNAACPRRPRRSQHFLLIPRAESISLQRWLPWGRGWESGDNVEGDVNPAEVGRGERGGQCQEVVGSSGFGGILQLLHLLHLSSPCQMQVILYPVSPFLQERRLAFVQSSKCHVTILCRILGSYSLLLRLITPTWSLIILNKKTSEKVMASSLHYHG